MESILIQNKSLTAREWGFDVLVAVCAFAFCCAQAFFASSTLVVRDEMFRSMVGYVTTVPPLPVFLSLALTTLPLVLRRVSPWLVYLFTVVTFLGVQGEFRGYSMSLAGPLVALFTVGCLRPRAETAIAAVIGAAAMFFSSIPVESTGVALLFRLQNVTYLIAAALAGYAVRMHREYLEAAEQRAAQAERSREEEAVRRVAEERVRIARELHDITAHSLTAVSIQAAAAERLVDRDPQAAKEAIATVRATAKSSLDEIRSMIGVLRDDNGAETAPTQGTERLGDLARYLEEAGVRTELDVAGYDRAAVPVFIDVALFGIAREAATNMVRHAKASSATIRLRTEGGRALLTVEDDGVGIAPPRRDTGHGLQGMAERTSLLNGAFAAEDRPGGGTVVRADIPVEGREP